MENEQADAGRDGRTRLARDQILRREQGQGNIHFPCSADHRTTGNLTYPVDPYSAMNPSRDKNLIKIEGKYRSGKGVWPFYCCDPGWSVFINVSKDIFSRKQCMGDDDDILDDHTYIRTT